MDSFGVHRPRNVDWKRAAALLYGDWGTSKAYVIGLAFMAAGFASLPIILAVCALTAVVAYNYILICKHFPDGGGVYSAARTQSRFMAVIGALLLVADLTVTAAMSGWDAMSYFHLPREYYKWVTILVIMVVGGINYFGPKHSGSIAVVLAVPTALVVLCIIAFSAPHLTTEHLELPHESFRVNWVRFVSVILALSGVEAIANLTGVMKLDKGASPENPKVGMTAAKSIVPVALEVVVGTALVAWAMLSLPSSMAPQLKEHYERMLSFLGEQYGTLALGAQFGKYFGWTVGLVVGMLLLSAVNTAVGALIGLSYLMGRDGEMPRSFTKLNKHGVPWLPLAIAVGLPVLVTLFSDDLDSLADLYAIGVVGAITVNLGSCVLNKTLDFKMWERVVMGVTFAILFAVELTIAKTKPNALFFAICILGVGIGLRSYAQRRAGLRTVTVSEEIAAAVAPEALATLRNQLQPTQSIMVAARGVTPVLRFALEEARLRGSNLYVLFVKELAVSLPGPVQAAEQPRWQNDPQASVIMTTMIELGKEQGVAVVPLYTVSENPAATILDLSATLGIDMLILGSPHRRTFASLLKGNVVGEVANSLPENIQLLLHG